LRQTILFNRAIRLLEFFLAAALGCALPLSAHHSFAADYDASKPVTLTGRVTKIDWMNPHVRFYLDVEDASGTVTNWVFELGSPNTLMRSGWTRNTLTVGERITVQGCRAKDSSNQGNATGIRSSDGKVLLSGRSAGQPLIAR
jgi:DNA/RNA endonuclease YhcR with UshA esterase domain